MSFRNTPPKPSPFEKLTVTPHVAASVALRERVAKGEKLTDDEYKTLLLGRGRRERRRMKIRTTDIRLTLDALKATMTPRSNKAKAARRRARFASAKARALKTHARTLQKLAGS